MIFPSHIFLLVFLPAVLLTWFGLRRVRSRLLCITIASYVFYGWWDYRFVALMFGSSLLDFACGRLIVRHRVRGLATGDAAAMRRAKLWLVIAVTGNLATLGFFKYYAFFIDSMNTLLAGIGMETSLPVLRLVLPIGISFYTFQSMSYTIDVYRGRCRATDDFLQFAAFVSLFPQLVAGPIVRYTDIEEQFAALSNQSVKYERIADGVWLFVIGLVKKVWVADSLAPLANVAFAQPDNVQLVTAWAGTVCYSLQLYYDFSGYSDMARGLGFILGFHFPINFDSPYRATNIRQFWNRWHISLSHWLRDYLYIPLGGSRHGTWKTMRNLFLTMFLGGLWHGAAWTFVVWGMYHGCLLAMHTGWSRIYPRGLPRIIAQPATLLAIALGWVMFRADGVRDALHLYAGMAGLHGLEPLTHFSRTLHFHLPELYGVYGGAHGVMFLAAILCVALWAPNSERLSKPRHPAWAVALVGIVIISLTTFHIERPFLYYQF